jgi:hypothetical protein
MQQLEAGALQLVARRRDSFRALHLELDGCWGTIRSAGHSGVPKHASAACERGQIPKCFAPGMLPLE